jgi:hypothetical protein
MPAGRLNRHEGSSALRSGLLVEIVPIDDETAEFSIDGSGQFVAGAVLDLDELFGSLGPYTKEPVVLTGQYEDEPRELVVASTGEAGAATLSQHRLSQIKPLLAELTADDRQSLTAWLREAGS